VVVAGARRHGGVQGLGHVRVVEVELAAGAVLHEAHELELGAVELGVGLGMEGQGLAGQILEAEAGDPAGGAGEGQIDQIGADADGLEDLGAVVAGEQGDADLGEDLAQPLLQGLAHVGLGLVGSRRGSLPRSIIDWVRGWASQWRTVSQVSHGQTALAP
jgi:hypothetical protein